LLEKVAILQREAGRVAALVKIREPNLGEPVNRETFVCTPDRSAWRKALDRDGCYILRASTARRDAGSVGVGETSAGAVGVVHTQLVHVEEAFKMLKSDPDLRPIHHQIESRAGAHIFVAFLAFCLMVTLRMKPGSAAPGLMPREVLRSLAAMKLVGVQSIAFPGRKIHPPPAPPLQGRGVHMSR